MTKILIVGAGLSGAVIARMCAEKGYEVSIIEKRDHIGGNCFDYLSKNKILIHKYGPHLFHTSNECVMNFLKRFSDFVDYKHKVKAMLNDGSLVTMPVNRETKRIVGEENILNVLFVPYTRKMWGMDPSQINRTVLNRVKIRDDDNEYYFPDDLFQCMPSDGYHQMFKRMLQHNNISVKLGLEFNKKMEEEYDHVFNSMAIDEYYDYCYGVLPYRSIKFHEYTIPVPKLLPVSTVNITHAGKYTRVTEWKNIGNCKIEPTNAELTTLTVEEPCDFKDNNFERYYPVIDSTGKNNEIYERYRTIENNKTTFIGRTGLYKYLDMDDAVAESMKQANEFLC